MASHRRRQERKVHLAADEATGDIRAMEFAPSRGDDSPIFLGLPEQILAGQEIGNVTDGGYDTRRCHAALLERGGLARIPIRGNGRLAPQPEPGDER